MNGRIIELGFDDLGVALWWWDHLGGTLLSEEGEYVLRVGS